MPLIVSSALFMETLDATVITTALPDIAHSFGRNPVELSSGITAYVLSLAVFIPVSGWVADRYGARHIFRLAIALFTLSSIACGFSNDLLSFVAWRSVQGFAGALMVPVGRLLVLRSADRRDLVRAIATLSTPALLGPVLGPPIGGFITTYANWRWIFFLNVPIGILGIVLVSLYIRPPVEGLRRTPLDFVGFLLTGGCFGLVMYGLDRLGHGGISEGAVAMAGGLAFGGWALSHARRTPHSLIDIGLMRLPTFRITVTGGSIFRISLGAAPFITPLLLQVGFGKSAFEAGLLVLATSFGNMSMKSVTVRILRRIGFRTVLIASSLLTAASLAACCLLTAQTPNLVTVVLLLASGLLRSMQFTCLNTIAFADVPSERMSAATSLSAMGQQVSLGMGVAVGAILLELSPMVRRLFGAQVVSALPEVIDFRVTFLVMTVIAALPVLIYWNLPRSAGEELSGHRRG